jgi:hypothetical protein
MQTDAPEDARTRAARQKEIKEFQRATQNAASPDLCTNATPAHVYRSTVSTATPASDVDAASPGSDASPAPTLSGPPSGGPPSGAEIIVISDDSSSDSDSVDTERSDRYPFASSVRVGEVVVFDASPAKKRRVRALAVSASESSFDDGDLHPVFESVQSPSSAAALPSAAVDDDALRVKHALGKKPIDDDADGDDTPHLVDPAPVVTHASLAGPSTASPRSRPVGILGRVLQTVARPLEDIRLRLGGRTGLDDAHANYTFWEYSAHEITPRANAATRADPFSSPNGRSSGSVARASVLRGDGVMVGPRESAARALLNARTRCGRPRRPQRTFLPRYVVDVPEQATDEYFIEPRAR